MNRIKNTENNWRPTVGLQIATFRTNENLSIERLSDVAKVSPETLKRLKEEQTPSFLVQCC